MTNKFKKRDVLAFLIFLLTGQIVAIVLGMVFSRGFELMPSVCVASTIAFFVGYKKK